MEILLVQNTWNIEINGGSEHKKICLFYIIAYDHKDVLIFFLLFNYRTYPVNKYLL